MESTYQTIEHPDLPDDVLTLRQALANCDNDTLAQTMQWAILNGYVLADIDQEPYTTYTLEKWGSEVDE